MKLKLIVVDFEIPSRVQRRGIQVGILAAVLLGGGAVAYSSSLVTWSSGQKLTAADLNASFAAVQTPPGAVIAFAGPVIPEGWLLCDGRLVSRATYSALYAAIGTVSGAGDGASTFNLPDYRGMFLRGVDGTAGADPDAKYRTAGAPGGLQGNAVGTLEADQFVSHTHVIQGPNQWLANSGSPGPYGISNGFTGHATAATDAAGGSETRPKNVAVNYIMKY